MYANHASTVTAQNRASNIAVLKSTDSACMCNIYERGKTRRWNEIIYNRDASIA